MRTAALLFVSTLALAQTPQFEVASIRVGVQDNNHNTNSDKGIFRTHNISLKRLIARAYDVDEGEVFGGPNWVESLGFDINAKIPEEFANNTRETVPIMLRNFLADRFHLTVHREQRETSGYVLAVAKKGVKMTPAKGTRPGSRMSTHNTELVAEGVTMEIFARDLTRMLEKPVTDKTELSGAFDFKMEWADSDPSDDRPSLFTALQEQLGLKLESAKVTYSAVVIDHAEKPGEN
ncbi:MAG TPA: TIGR03435 family protein [Bryobacteraceae bacterium]|nr:TIGR03435 family protein [Bryobacteraceae bacterium]